MTLAGKIGAAVALLLVVAGATAPFFAPFPPGHQDLVHELKGPSIAHWLGTGENGVDLLSHLLYGARISLIVGIGTVLISGALGTALGALAGYAGGWLDDALMRIVDVLLAFPGILLAIFITAVLPPSLTNVIVALVATGWVGYARLVRSQVLALRDREFVLAARSLGANDSRIVLRHLLPNVLGPVVVQASFGMPAAILAEASLSFLGLGVPPGTPSWGALVEQGAQYLLIAPHVAVFSGLTIAVTVLGFNLLGDALRDRLDPRRL
jgi:peptide/nickel transport system permease protein